jgi:hypothetical protein
VSKRAEPTAHVKSLKACFAWGFPNRRRTDSRRRTQQGCHDHSATDNPSEAVAASPARVFFVQAPREAVIADGRFPAIDDFAQLERTEAFAAA